MSHEPGFNLRREKLKAGLVMVWKTFSRWLSDTKREGKKTREIEAPFTYMFTTSTLELQTCDCDGAADLDTDVTDHVGTKPRLLRSENSAINMTSI